MPETQKQIVTVGVTGLSGTPFSAGPGTFTLRFNQSKAVAVRFAPPSTGSFTGTIAIVCDDPAQPSGVTVTLTGTGL
jgi:hypothetical protein